MAGPVRLLPLRATDPGNDDPEQNPLWALHESFNEDRAWSPSTAPPP